MSARLYLDKQSPAVFEALTATAARVREQAAEAGLERSVVELVNLRCSQLNRCAFCLDRHSRMALEAGVTPQQLAVLAAWRSTTLFAARERAALEIAETVTTVAGGHPDEAARERLREHLTDTEISVLTWAAITINAFNRVSILSRHPVPARDASGHVLRGPAGEGR